MTDLIRFTTFDGTLVRTRVDDNPQEVFRVIQFAQRNVVSCDTGILLRRVVDLFTIADNVSLLYQKKVWDFFSR